LCHRSWCAENPGSSSNERLEFLGDAVLGLVVTDHLFRTHPEMPEGELAKVRASVVNSAALAELAAELDVGAGLMLGKGEDQSGGREKPSILADAAEALIGAVYLDRGWVAAADMVMRLLGDRIEVAAAGPGGQDYKTRLQELCARQFDQLPIYSLKDEGPDHAKAFEAVVHVHGRPQGFGRGRSKKQAEQAAAREAWERLKSTVDGGAEPRPMGGTVPARGSTRRPASELGPPSGPEADPGSGSRG
jgi:ribonuclease III